MHKQYTDNEGTFGEWQEAGGPGCTQLVERNGQVVACRAKVQIRTWESNDGGYEDAHYRCEAGHTWWIDGIDS